MPICPGNVRQVLAGLAMSVCGGEALAEERFPYGMDPVPDTSYFLGAWDHYGSDPTPRTIPNEGHFKRTYDLDPVPVAQMLGYDQMDHVALYRAMQHLTGAVEITPGADAPAKPDVKAAQPNPTRTYRRWRRFGR